MGAHYAGIFRWRIKNWREQIKSNTSKQTILAHNCIRCTPRWLHQMETFSALLAMCAGNSPVNGEFTTQRPVTQSLDVPEQTVEQTMEPPVIWNANVLCVGNSPVIGEFPAQTASNAELMPIWWRHHVTFAVYYCPRYIQWKERIGKTGTLTRPLNCKLNFIQWGI